MLFLKRLIYESQCIFIALHVVGPPLLSWDSTFDREWNDGGSALMEKNEDWSAKSQYAFEWGIHVKRHGISVS